MFILMVIFNFGISVSMGMFILIFFSGSLNIEMKCNIEFRLYDDFVEFIYYIGKVC